jgi:ribonuclease VapC
VVIDTSALIALFFEEPSAYWVAEQLEKNASNLCMSTVNLTETLILILDRQPTLYSSIERRILESSIRFVAPSIEHAKVASAARLRFPLNLGDCFAYSLAYLDQLPILTLDTDFEKTDVHIVIPKPAR